ncbi:hypothetical protein BJV74DRAFT_860450, partial [Russula compacta]
MHEGATVLSFPRVAHDDHDDPPLLGVIDGKQHEGPEFDSNQGQFQVKVCPGLGGPHGFRGHYLEARVCGGWWVAAFSVRSAALGRPTAGGIDERDYVTRLVGARRSSCFFVKERRKRKGGRGAKHLRFCYLLRLKGTLVVPPIPAPSLWARVLGEMTMITPTCSPTLRRGN